MYVAEFKHNGVDYQIVAEQMGIEEVVKVVASIITGEKDIAVDEGACPLPAKIDRKKDEKTE